MCLTWWGKRFPSTCYSCWLCCCKSLMSSDWALSVWCVVDPVGWTVNLQRSAGLPQQYACMTVWMCHSLCGVLHLGQTMASFSILSLSRPALSPWQPCHATPCPQSGLALHLSSLLGQLGLDSHCWPHPRLRLAFCCFVAELQNLSACYKLHL